MKNKKSKYWADINDEGIWGVESSNINETFDGHYILLVPHEDSEKAIKIAVNIAKHLNMYSIKLC